MMDWQPMETAEQNRTKRLLWKAGELTCGWWDDDRYAKEPRPYWRSERGFLYGVRWDRTNQPLYWAPIAAPFTPSPLNIDAQETK